MNRNFGPHPDPVVQDLQMIRRLRWSQPVGFRRMEVLLDHPLIAHLSRDSEKLSRRVKALREALKRTVKQIDRHERKQPPPLDRSLAFASTLLLRLDPATEDESVEELRKQIAAQWKRNDSEQLTIEGFRQHLEVPAVYEALAAEFRLYARDQAERQGFGMPDSGNAERVTFPGPPSGKDMSNVARRLWDLERGEFERRLTAIREGMVRVRNESEMVKLLVLLTESARQELKAVDHVDISEWFGNPTLNSYLHLQLNRAAREEVAVERIRLVSEEELNDVYRLRQLREFMKLHEDAFARLLLCPLRVAEDLETSFRPRMGLLLVDPKSEPTLLTGWVGQGMIERACLYVQPTTAMREYQAEYERLRRHVISRQDTELRAKLERLTDPAP